MIFDLLKCHQDLFDDTRHQDDSISIYPGLSGGSINRSKFMAYHPVVSLWPIEMTTLVFAEFVVHLLFMANPPITSCNWTGTKYLH